MGAAGDLGSHRFFSTNKRVNRYRLSFTEKDYVMVDRLTWMYYQKYS